MITWSASSGSGLLQIEELQGSQTGEGWLTYSIDTSNRQPGGYVVMIVIYAGAAGTQTFYVLFMVGEDVYSNMVLLTVR